MRGQKREFTDEEIDYIISNWGKESAHSMKKKFNCSWYAVCRIAEENGLDLPESNEWTNEQVKMLETLSEKYHYKKIAKMLDKPPNAVYVKAKRLGITLIQTRRDWTIEEDEMLKELWGSISIETLAKKMKRSVYSLKIRANKLGIGPMINNNYEVLTVSDVCELLCVTYTRITTTWVKLGLNLKKKKLTKNKNYYVVTLEDLILFLKDNQNEWDSRNLEEYGLASEPEWLTEKRKRDRLENPLWYRRWTDEEVKKAEQLFSMGKTYAEIALSIDRKEEAVARMLRSLGHEYELPRYWKGKEIKYLRENYRNMTYSEIARAIDRTPEAVCAKASELGYQKKLIKTNKQE